MTKTVLEKEITMTKFLSHFLGINPAIARNMTHKDAQILFPNLKYYHDNQFYQNVNTEDMINYVRVKDKNNQVMYYNKPKLTIDAVYATCSDEEYKQHSKDIELTDREIDKLLESILNINLNDLSKWELCLLSKNLKIFHSKGYNTKVTTIQINKVKTKLHKLRKEDQIDKYKRK